ncbi:Uncharacterised protein [Mycobacteroides abscessus subsp. abscessus]|nr:Uncharacterised protein [Mycobacteroides abscessus subsp. abscessus]
MGKITLPVIRKIKTNVTAAMAAMTSGSRSVIPPMLSRFRWAKLSTSTGPGAGTLLRASSCRLPGSLNGSVSVLREM